MSIKTQRNVDTNISIRKPKMYNAIIHNDDYTPMDFVVDILISIFNKNTIEATNLMMEVHNNGQSTIGVYTYDIAMTKKILADQLSKQQGNPLKISVEEAII